MKNPHSPIAEDLLSSGPHPDLSEPLMLFGRFVGTWDLTVEFFDESGEAFFCEPGAWSFGWVLDGRVIQDVLTYPPIHDHSAYSPGTRGIGSSLRYYNPRTATWHVIWLGAVTGLVVFLQARESDTGIVLEPETEPDGTLNQWRFTEIDDNTFLWTGHDSQDNGESWRLHQRMTATRRSLDERHDH